jgi:protein-disulfide isomerase
MLRMPRLIVPVDERRDHTRGPAHAPITLVEYGDYQCSFCEEAFWILNEIESRYRRDLLYVFRHFPLTEIHPLAMGAAEAAEAAGAQGKFWPMHDQLFQNYPSIDPEMLLDIAAALDLDLDSFETDMIQHRHRHRIRDDFMTGVRSGVTGTPTIFLNGERLEGPIDVERFVREIEAILDHRRPRAEP